jgi:hypothetical protein
MSNSEQNVAQFTRVGSARRQTQHQLDLIDRQITRRMTTFIPQLGRRQSGYRRGKASEPGTFLERYRTNLAAITPERQPEIDALSRKFARQDAAIAVLRARAGSDGKVVAARYRSGRQDAMSTIGDLERRAGIGASPAERTAFWLQFHHLKGEACLNVGVAELRQMIAPKETRPDLRPKTHAVRRTRETLPPLTPEQEAALQAYAARHGRCWKSILNHAWMGGPPHDEGGLLRGLRNSHGQAWLRSYRLPKPDRR